MKERRATLRSVFLTVLLFVTGARDMLKIFLGTSHSSNWEEVGFVKSLMVPHSVSRLKLLLEKMTAYLTANPTRQNNELNITIARAQTLLIDLQTAETAVGNQKKVVGDAKKDRDAKFKTLRTAIGGLFKEMVVLLDPLDDVFLSFGFRKPGALALPDVPTNVMAVLVGATAAAVKWDHAARAEHYRVWKRVVGVDDELIPVGSRGDLDFIIEGLPAGATIEIAVSAVNNGGESAKTEVVTITTAA